MNNCFHADFSQRLRRLVHERETERLQQNGGGGRQKRVWITGHLSARRNPLIQKGSEAFSPFLFLIKSLSIFPVLPPASPSPRLCPFLGKLSKQSEAEREERDNKSRLPPPWGTRVSSVWSRAPLWHTDSFTWCETLHGALNLDSFYHNRITRHPPPTPLFLSLCLSFACRHKQPELPWLCFLYFLRV